VNNEPPHFHIWNSRVTTGPGKSWKVMGFRKTKLQAWVVMENNIGHGKSWKVMLKPWKGHGKFTHNVVKFLQLH